MTDKQKIGRTRPLRVIFNEALNLVNHEDEMCVGKVLLTTAYPKYGDNEERCLISIGY
jgi:hypothetical protein